MKNILFAIAIFCFAQFSYATEIFDAEIFVSNYNEDPISNYEVQFFDLNGNFLKKGNTDEHGKFLLQMSPGEYHLKLLSGETIKKEADIEIPELVGRKIYHRVRIHVLYEERTVFEIEDLHFEYNSSKILEGAYPILDRLFNYLDGEQGAKYEISGHTDSDGSESDNMRLSKDRAEAVMNYLIEKGISSDRLTAKGYGESIPISDNDTEEGRAENRRTEVKLLE
jgi:outer membrane protein OmpA-like peptidoglycan-associated protein